MDHLSPMAQEIARLKSETRTLRNKRHRGMIALLFGAAGLAADLAGLPLGFSLALWSVGAVAWVLIKNA